MPKGWLWRRRSEGDIGDELRAHITQRAADITAEGVPQDEAFRRARQQFGVLEAYERACRREQRFSRITHFTTGMTRDFVYAWRRLRATPMFTIFAVVSLAVGIGVTTAIYSIVASIFFKPAGIPNPGRVAVVVGSSVYQGGTASWNGVVSKADFDDLAAGTTAFDRIDAAMPFFQALVSDERSDTVQGEAVTGGFFETIGVRPAAGRTLDRSDDDSQRAVAVLSYAFWRSRYGGDRSAVGGVVRIGGHPFEVVGVAAAGFDGMSLALPRLTSVWIPHRTAVLFPNAAAADRRPPREQRRLTIVGRLAKGRTSAQAGAEIAALGERLDATFPTTARTFEGAGVPIKRRWGVRTVEKAHATFAETGRRFGLLIMILVAMVLVVACTNLANLTLSRGAARRHEHAVRRSLGASRWRLVREQCVESAIVAVLGGVFAFVVIRGLFYVFSAEVPISQAFSIELAPELSTPALLVAAGASALSLLVFGLGPALRLTRGPERAALAQDGGAVVRGHSARQRRSIRWQVAIASAFFLVATMATRAVLVEARHDSGIDLDRVSVAFVDFRLQRWDEARARRAIEAITRELGEQSALESAAISSGMPFGTTTTPFLEMTQAGGSFVKGAKYPEALALVATPAIFRTLGVPILRGRGFDERDGAGARRVVVMNELAAREMFGTTDAVGRDLTFQMWAGRSANLAPVTATVIGIAGDTDAQFLTRRSSGAVYIPLAQQYEPSLTVVGRARRDTDAATAALRAAIRAADPEVSVGRAGAGSTVLAGFYYAARIAATVAASLGLLALLLSMVGLHGVLAQMVTMRTRELGLRMALGAEARQIARMVLGDGFRPVVQGLVIGLLIGVLGRFIVRATVAPAVGIFDPIALAIIPIPVVLAGFLACYLPARRAAEVDPNVALRAI